MAEKGSKRFDVMLAGVGGKGVLTSGRLIAEAGMGKYKAVTFSENYGPQKRGGDVECTVIFSDGNVGSPSMQRAQSVIIMDPLQFKLFVERVVPGGVIVIDSSVIKDKVERTDVTTYYVPATQTALAMGAGQIANSILLGAYVSITGVLAMEDLDRAIAKRMAGGRRANMIEINKEAFRKGAELAAAKEPVTA